MWKYSYEKLNWLKYIKILVLLYLKYRCSINLYISLGGFCPQILTNKKKRFCYLWHFITICNCFKRISPRRELTSHRNCSDSLSESLLPILWDWSTLRIKWFRALTYTISKWTNECFRFTETIMEKNHEKFSKKWLKCWSKISYIVYWLICINVM